MTTDLRVELAGDRTLTAQAAEPRAADALALFWLNGSPHTGALLEPVVRAAEARHIRAVTYARPGYGGSTPQPGRNVASAASDVAAVADALGIERFAVMGYSGGGPHALACAALLPDRVVAAVALACVAPYTDAFDWFGGMAGPGALRAARQGRGARARFADADEFDPTSFTASDWSALEGEWKSVGDDAVKAGSAGPDGLIDDDVAFAADWGLDPERIEAPVLLVQGGEDRVVPRPHADSLLRLIPTAQLWLRPRDGHVSVLKGMGVAMDWLVGGAR
jgi:pimeloyl-ACP methyl ester carboxylesterase